ncbi:unnamed protein product [Malus baccata var. baccata]
MSVNYCITTDEVDQEDVKFEWDDNCEQSFQPILIDRVLEAQMNDEETQELIQTRNDWKKKDLRIRESDGMLMQEGRMYVSNNAELKKEILDEAHVSAYAMHPGGTKMYHTIRPFYYWPGMKREIAEYVSRCAICQQVKAEKKKPFELMQPLPVPQWKWEDITMDFVYKLPRARSGINLNLKVAQYCQKSLADKHATDRVYKIGDWLSLWRGVVRFRKKDLTYDEEPMTILDWKDKVLRNKTVCLVKVLWSNHSVEEATWETEDRMKEMYPRLFNDY